MKNIMIVGVGGQGTLLTSRIIGNLAIKKGYDVKISEVHGMAQRGGSVVTYVRYGEKVYKPVIEEGEADVLICFEKLEALRYLHYLKDSGIMLLNSIEILPITSITGLQKYPEDIEQKLAGIKLITLNAKEKAIGLGNPKVANVVILGMTAKVLGFDKEDWIQVIKETVPSKLLDLNLKAFEVGYNS